MTSVLKAGEGGERVAFFQLEEDAVTFDFVIYDKEGRNAWIESDMSVRDYGIDER